MGTNPKRADLVFEGGGVKGIGLAGAFWELDRQGWSPERVAGTSAGAITAALVAVGYRGDDLKRILLEEMEFPKFADGGGGLLAGGLEMLRHKGLHKGEYFLDWMRQRLEKKKITTFGQLRTHDTSDDLTRRYRLQVIASDVSLSRMLVLPADAHYLGVEPDELEIADAVRMSMSIPIFFDPVVRRNPASGNEHVVVDGGMLSNFPVWLFDTKDGQRPRWPTFGMLLVAPSQRHPLGPGPEAEGHDEGDLNIVQYLSAIAHTAMEAHDRLYVERANYARTIPIQTCGVGTTQFDISPALAGQLFDAGRQGAADFLKTWDFAAYTAAFRAGEPQPSRRQVVVERMRASKPSDDGEAQHA